MVNVSGDVVLPMTTVEVIDGLRKGRLSAQSLVWRIGMHDWTSIADVPQLRLAAGSLTPPPAATRVTLPLFSAQAEGQGRRNTLPFGFPAVKDPATVREPAGVDPPLAVYERPVASLTFSASGRADWQSNADSPRHTPVPSVTAPLSIQPTPSTPPASLAPTTTEADARDRLPSREAWGNLDELLANERRAEQRSSRHVVVAAAVVSVTLAAVFALWIVRSPAPDQPEPRAQGTQPSPAPGLAPTLEATAAPSASEAEPTPAVSLSVPKPVAPHAPRRTKPTAPARSSSEAPSDLQGAELSPETRGTASGADIAPLEPAPVASTQSRGVPTPSAPAAPTASATAPTEPTAPVAPTATAPNPTAPAGSTAPVASTAPTPPDSP